MPDRAHLDKRLKQLAERRWDEEAIGNRFRKMVLEGIPEKRLDPGKILSNKQRILDRVQQRAEEYNFIARNCAQGTAASLLEEFGLGNGDVIRALANFPGMGGTGGVCGGITGSLVALGLYFGDGDPLVFDQTGPNMKRAQTFMASFEKEVGYRHCADIQEKVIFGRNMDPGASEENMKAFADAKGFEKCGLVPGIGARLAAEYIINSMG